MPGAETCIGAGPLARAVEARLGHPAWAPASAAHALIESYVEKRAGQSGWHAHVVLTDTQGAVLGERDVTNDDVACDALDQPLILMLALIIDPSLFLAHAANEQRTQSAETPTMTNAPERMTEGPRSELSPPRSRNGGQVELQAGAAVAAGLLPGVAIGLGMNQAVPVGAWSIEFGGRLWLPREEEAGSGRNVTMSFAEITARACPMTWREETVSLRSCAGLEGGLIIAQAFGFTQIDHRARPAALVSGSLEGSLHVVGPAWLGLRLTGLVPVFRERFVYLGQDAQNHEIFRMSVVAGLVDLSLGVRF